MSITDIDEPPPYQDPVGLHGVHLLTCRSIWYDPEKSEPFALGGIYTHLDLPDGSAYPVRLNRMFVYFQLWGDPGEYQLRVRLVRIETDANNEEVEIQLGENAYPREFPLPRICPITGLAYVEEFAYAIGHVPFGVAGIYEYQLWADGIDEPIARERILARERDRNE